VQSECISLKKLILDFSFAIPGTSAAIESIFYHKFSVDWWQEPFPCWNYQHNDSYKNTFWGAFVQWLLYFDFRQSKITSRNSFIYEVQDICWIGKNNSFNISWKLTSNKIL
jgi:hypothetical protein